MIVICVLYQQKWTSEAMYDFIYPKIGEKCLIPHLLQKCSWKKKKNELTGINHIPDGLG